jgi:hypothetical protein
MTKQKIELSKEDEDYLTVFEKAYGKVGAEEMRKVLEKNAEMKLKQEIQETLSIPDFSQMKSWSKILKTSDAKAYLPFFVKILQMCNEVNDLPDWHGITFMLIRTPKNVVLLKRDTIVVNPDSTENLLKGEDELPEDRIIMNEEEEEE